MARLSDPPPLPLAPHFVNNDYVTAEITYTTACTSWGTGLVTGYFVWYACMTFTMKALVAPASGRHWSSIMIVLYEVMLWLLLRLLHQPGERLCYGGRASQERINVSTVPTAPAPWVSFQPLSQRLAYPGFSEQCRQWEQQDNWHHEQDQRHNFW